MAQPLMRDGIPNVDGDIKIQTNHPMMISSYCCPVFFLISPRFPRFFSHGICPIWHPQRGQRGRRSGQSGAAGQLRRRPPGFAAGLRRRGFDGDSVALARCGRRFPNDMVRMSWGNHLDDGLIMGKHGKTLGK